MHSQQPFLEGFSSSLTTQQVSSEIQPSKAKPESRFEKRSFRLSDNLFLYSARGDLSTTDDFLHHSQYVEYRGVCGGQPCSSMSYGHNSAWFTEVGRPARIFGCGPRSVGCTLTANIVNDASVLGIAEFLHHKGKIGKAVAWGLLVVQTASNFGASWHNTHVTLNENLYVPFGATDIIWYNP